MTTFKLVLMRVGGCPRGSHIEQIHKEVVRQCFRLFGENAVRSYGNALGSATHWVFAALIANIFPWFAGRFGGGPIFSFFAVMMVFQLLFVWKMMPETKGVSLEELEKKLI